MKTITAIVETPKGSAQKYKYDPGRNWFKLSKILPAGMVFPFDFGFIPDTKGEDGDPLDIIIISELRSFPGCMMDCRIIGAITATQSEKGKAIRNDRYIGIPDVSDLFANIQKMEDLPRATLEQVERFFENYNEMTNKKFKPIKRIDSKEAMRLMQQGGKK